MFADGDAHVQMTYGSPRTFFVAARLADDAAVQDPSRLRATILTVGPQASVVEETPTDLPLTLACPLGMPWPSSAALLVGPRGRLA